MRRKKLLFIHKRGAWPPQGGRTKCWEWAAKCGEWAATSLTLPPHVKSIAELRRGRHFNGLWAATSRGRHLSKRGAPPKAHMLISKKIFTQSNLNQVYIVSFDLLIDFAFKFSPFLSPFILFLF
jgi:hypothetical protein